MPGKKLERVCPPAQGRKKNRYLEAVVRAVATTLTSSRYKAAGCRGETLRPANRGGTSRRSAPFGMD